MECKVCDYYSYNNPIFAPLKEPATAVVGAAQKVNRYLDTIQEWFWMIGAKNTSAYIHSVAHKYPALFDEFVDMLHERHLHGIYPATEQMTREIADCGEAFAIAIEVLDELNDALEAFRTVTDNGKFRPMCLKTEELMLKNSAEYTKILEIWEMVNDADDCAAFDTWVKVTMMEDGD